MKPKLVLSTVENEHRKCIVLMFEEAEINLKIFPINEYLSIQIIIYQNKTQDILELEKKICEKFGWN
jgi:hypothetical protein